MEKEYEDEETRELHDWTENRKEKAYLKFEDDFAKFCIGKGFAEEELNNIDSATMGKLLREFLASSI